jgi:TRAP-type mannitol/chloroaromatic compound transport system permease small subunit
MLVVYFSYDFTLRSFLNQEISASATGLTHRWIIKSFLPVGFTLLGLAGVAVLLRKVVELFGPPDLREKVHEIEEQEAEPLDKITLDKIALDKEGPG